MSTETRPWLGWATEYPDEGAVAVDAPDEAAARAAVEKALNAHDGVDPGDPMPVTVVRATSADFSRLQDEIENLRDDLNAKKT